MDNSELKRQVLKKGCFCLASNDLLGVSLFSKNTNTEDFLDLLIRRIFEIIDTYYIEHQAKDVKELLLLYLLLRDNREEVFLDLIKCSPNVSFEIKFEFTEGKTNVIFVV